MCLQTVPSLITLSKDDCPEVEATMTARVDAALINRLAAVMRYSGSGKAAERAPKPLVIPQVVGGSKRVRGCLGSCCLQPRRRGDLTDPAAAQDGHGAGVRVRLVPLDKEARLAKAKQRLEALAKHAGGGDGDDAEADGSGSESD